MALIAGTLIIHFIALTSSCEKANIKRKKAKLSRIRYRICASFVFLFVMTATVVAGLLEVAYDRMLFTFVFAGVCVLEGVYMFMFYVVFNRKVSLFPRYTKSLCTSVHSLWFEIFTNRTYFNTPWVLVYTSSRSIRILTETLFLQTQFQGLKKANISIDMHIFFKWCGLSTKILKV